MGLLTLHDLHEKNLEAMQCVVDLGRQLGRPIFTSLWSSRADRPSVGSGERRLRVIGYAVSKILLSCVPEASVTATLGD